MPPGRYTGRRRTAAQALADERSDQLATSLGRGLKEARLGVDMSQASAAAASGIAQSTWSLMERGRGANLSVRVWMRATHAVGADLHAYLEATSGAERPRDAVHLRHQELLAQYAARGQWKPMPEARTGNGFVDMVLERHAETAVVEVWDWLADVGDAFRSWDRKLEQWRARVGASGQAARVAGIWVVRASRRNHRLVHDHPAIFRARFPASGAAWLAALTDQARPMPPEPALIWVSVRGDRLYPARL